MCVLWNCDSDEDTEFKTKTSAYCVYFVSCHLLEYCQEMSLSWEFRHEQQGRKNLYKYAISSSGNV